MRIVVFLHVITMFVAVALSYGTISLLWVAARARDVDALRGIARTIARLRIAISLAYMVGIAFGLAAVVVSGFDPFQTWLVAAYILTLLAIVSATFVTGRWLARVAAELGDPSDAALVPRAFADRRASALLVLDGLVIVAIVADMVLKPL